MMGRASRRRKERRAQKRRELATTIENWTAYDLTSLTKRRNTEKPHAETSSPSTDPGT